MKKTKIILLVLLSFNIYANKYDCPEVIDIVQEFLIEHRDYKDNKTDISEKMYNESLDDYQTYDNQIVESGCSNHQKDSLIYNMQYYFALNTVKRYGDISTFKRLMANASTKIDSIQIKNKDCFSSKDKKVCDEYFGEFLFIGKENKEISKIGNDLYKTYKKSKTKIDFEIDKIKRLYKDLNIFIDKDKFDEMQILYNKFSNKTIMVHIEPPGIYYKKDKYKEKYSDQLMRMDYLYNNPIEFKLTKYDKNNGFYMSVPMVPVVQEKRNRNPEYTYAITIDGTEKYRFEFSSKKTDDVYIELMDEWEFKEQVPYNWTKIIVSKEFIWKYNDEKLHSSKVAWYDGIDEAKVKDAYKEMIIPIERKNDYLIYQRSDFEQGKYSLEINKKKTKLREWLKYLLIGLLFGVGYAEA